MKVTIEHNTTDFPDQPAVRIAAYDKEDIWTLGCIMGQIGNQSLRFVFGSIPDSSEGKFLLFPIWKDDRFDRTEDFVPSSPKTFMQIGSAYEKMIEDAKNEGFNNGLDAAAHIVKTMAQHGVFSIEEVAKEVESAKEPEK